MSIRVAPGRMAETMQFLGNLWKKYAPEYPLTYRYFDEVLEQRYQSEARLGTVFTCFSVLAVLISCLGLFVLATYMIEVPTKEIGIRKILGASMEELNMMLTREFAVNVIIANAVAWPVTFFLMRSWLNNFVYKAPMGLYVFAAAGALTFLIAVATVSFNTIRAARANPASSLRYE